MARFEIEFSKSAAKDYKKLPKDYKVLIDLVLSKLTHGVPVDIKPVAGEENIYRIRVGKYRILATVIENSILITKIGPRGDVYK
ncbi:MAG: type II toxin-antitoxin system RelE/ParE family toxin [Thermodesulfovibrionales bacterium]|jgi:mRNA interferase RelE/StbE|nr:type II toxin-antitoxin system RelE/ParE family toxin [Thermodesulfovibrionales bacterium]